MSGLNTVNDSLAEIGNSKYIKQESRNNDMSHLRKGSYDT